MNDTPSGVLRSIRCRAHYAIGLLALRLRAAAFALRRFDAARRICPDHIGATYHRAWVLGELGRFEESIKTYETVLERAPSSSLYHGIAHALQSLGRHDEAITAFNAALDREPHSVSIQYNLAESGVQ